MSKNYKQFSGLKTVILNFRSLKSFFVIVYNYLTVVTGQETMIYCSTQLFVLPMCNQYLTLIVHYEIFINKLQQVSLYAVKKAVLSVSKFLLLSKFLFDNQHLDLNHPVDIFF